MLRRIAVVVIFTLSLLAARSQSGDEDFGMLSAYRDFFGQATDFSLSFARYRPRGYDYRLGGIPTWNGVPIENWENGTVSWRVLGNLSSLNLSSDSRTLEISAPNARQGFRLVGSLSNRTYTYRASANYSLVDHKGWSATFDVSRRWGESLSVDGISTDAYSYFATVSKRIKNHSIELSLLYAPSERSTQRASTAEAYELTGNNLYNPAWGWQSGKKRSVRSNATREPIAILSHRMSIGEEWKLQNILSARIGTESQSGLTWQNTPNPYPDYYRYMPSYQKSPTMQQVVRDAWLNNDLASQIDFRNLYNINEYNSPQAKYAMEQRCRDVQQYRLASELSSDFFNGGFEATYAVNHNYKRIEDLMGADHWLDIDAFVEQDDDVKDKVQNNLRNPDFEARQGDMFGYYYSMTMLRGSAWAVAQHKLGRFTGRLRGDVSAVQYQRTGHFEKENFGGNASYGESEQIHNYDYSLLAEGWYSKGGALRVGGSLGYRTLSPSPSQLFISREYRNGTVPRSIKEQIVTGEMYVNYRKNGLRFDAALYYTQINDKSQLHHFYDDNVYQYTNYWMQGISERYMGLELAAEFPLYDNLSAAVAVALSDNRYTSNPIATQWRESTGDQLREAETVYYDNLHLSGSPQNAVVVTLKYTPRSYVVNLTLNHVANNFVSISPLRRTERSQAGIAGVAQEKLSNATTVDLFGGKTFYLPNDRSIGVYAGVNNLLNNRDVRTGGYESYRTVATAASDTRYYYALGINGFISVTYRF